jgi:hypothetical protein
MVPFLLPPLRFARQPYQYCYSRGSEVPRGRGHYEILFTPSMKNLHLVSTILIFASESTLKGEQTYAVRRMNTVFFGTQQKTDFML